MLGRGKGKSAPCATGRPKLSLSEFLRPGFEEEDAFRHKQATRIQTRMRTFLMRREVRALFRVTKWPHHGDRMRLAEAGRDRGGTPELVSLGDEIPYRAEFQNNIFEDFPGAAMQRKWS